MFPNNILFLRMNAMTVMQKIHLKKLKLEQ